MLIQTNIGFADAVLWPKILGNNLGILTQILTIMDYYFFFFIFLYKYLDLLTAELVFKLSIPQRYVHNVEKNWENFVFIRVKNFANF